MEKFIRKIYNDTILDEATHKFGFNKKNVYLLGGFQSFVYECMRNGRSYILKITHSSHRNENMLKGELDWIQYLSDNNVKVCMPVLSRKSKLIEIIEIGNSYFSAVVYEKAKGRPIGNHDWKPEFFEKWGETVGKLHALSKHYHPKDQSTIRPQWYSEDNYDVNKFLPVSQIKVKQKFKNLVKKIKKFPRDADSFGLIHADMNSTNFFINNGEITIFDFDGCVYSWFIHDIAILTFCSIQFNHVINDKVSFLSLFMKSFLEGYHRENTLDSFWLSKLRDFLKLEEIGEYTLIHRSCNLNDLSRLNQCFMNNRKDNIEKDMPLVDLNFI